MSDLKLIRCAAACGMTALSAWGGAAWAAAQPDEKIISVPTGTIVIPSSSIPRAEDMGIRAHTNIERFVPTGMRQPASIPSGKYETPASLACVYGLTTFVTGCNPETLKTVATTGSKVVVIVDAFDYPTAMNDLSTYSAQFGLPPITADNFQVVYASGKQPAQDTTGGWEVEEALDIEMAHAMAPNAKIVLVEAVSNSFAHLFGAEVVAGKIAAAAGGGEVSNSWSGGEKPTERKIGAADFHANNVVYLASAGDSHGIGIPAALKDVIAVGGTSILRDGSGNFLSQKAWIDTGGGSTEYIMRPGFQKPVAAIVGTFRGTPDISLVADPQTGVWLYDTTPVNGRVLDWAVYGGTSVSSPALAGILNSAGSFAKSTDAELKTVYGGFTNQANWTDITTGTCGNNGGSSAVAGWDFCTGVGVPQGLAGK